MKQINQATFDDVVKENMEEFEMTRDEAVADAVEQFSAQGVDLSNIVKEALVDEDGATHPANDAVAALDSCLEADPIDPPKVVEALNAVVPFLNEQSSRSMVGQKGMKLALKALDMRDRVAEETKKEYIIASLSVLAGVLKDQPDLLRPPPAQEGDNPILESQENEDIVRITNFFRENSSDPEIIALTVSAISRGCTKHEGNRQTFVKEGIIALLTVALEKFNSVPDVVVHCSRCLRTLTLDDDLRVPFGHAHEHAKAIVNDHDAIPIVITAAKLHVSNPSAIQEALKTVSKLAVRNEFCQAIVDAGGLNLVVTSLREHDGDHTVAIPCMSVLRAIAGNDDVKLKIYEEGGITIILNTIEKHLTKPGVAEQGCAALSAVVLRNETNAKAVVDGSGANILIKCLHVHSNSPKVLKVAARAIRNVVARNRQYVEHFLGEGAEEQLNRAMQHQKSADDAKAALRDLGCKVHLREEWTGMPNQS